MIADLLRDIRRELDVAVASEIETIAASLSDELSGVAVLYYGSTLRTGDFDGVMDFYVLTDGLVGSFMRRLGMQYLWPDVSYHEFVIAGRSLRAKVATMPLATFERATRGEFLDTTIWTRFVQPSALVWRVDSHVARRVTRAISDAVITAARFAAVIGPVEGTPRDFWLALFRETYRAELRIEPPGREASILQYDPERYARLLPIAWRADDIAFQTDGAMLAPRLTFDLCRDTAAAWLLRADAGKVLNIARLIKAAFTFDGAARYGLWKVRRHTGVIVELTPWRERHPILASVPVLWRVMQSRLS